jgi:hypothetical protein
MQKKTILNKVIIAVFIQIIETMQNKQFLSLNSSLQKVTLPEKLSRQKSSSYGFNDSHVLRLSIEIA